MSTVCVSMVCVSIVCVSTPSRNLASPETAQYCFTLQVQGPTNTIKRHDDLVILACHFRGMMDIDDRNDAPLPETRLFLAYLNPPHRNIETAIKETAGGARRLKRAAWPRACARCASSGLWLLTAQETKKKSSS